jgi:predicted transcriptional regulator
MKQAFPFVDIETPVQLLAPMISPENPAVVVRDFRADKIYVLTGYDVLKAV